MKLYCKKHGVVEHILTKDKFECIKCNQEFLKDSLKDTPFEDLLGGFDK